MYIREIRIDHSTNDFFSVEDIPYSVEQFDKVTFHASLRLRDDSPTGYLKIGVVLADFSEFKMGLPLAPECRMTIEAMCKELIVAFESGKYSSDRFPDNTVDVVEKLKTIVWPEHKKAPTTLLDS